MYVHDVYDKSRIYLKLTSVEHGLTKLLPISEVYWLSERRAEIYAGCVQALLVNHNDDVTSVVQQHSDRETGQTDRDTDGRTLDMCFTFSAMDTTGVKSVLIILLAHSAHSVLITKI